MEKQVRRSLYAFFQRLRGRELHGLGSGNCDFLACTGISALPRLALHQLEAPEAENGKGVAFLQRGFNDAEQTVIGYLGLGQSSKPGLLL